MKMSALRECKNHPVKPAFWNNRSSLRGRGCSPAAGRPRGVCTASSADRGGGACTWPGRGRAGRTQVEEEGAPARGPERLRGGEAVTVAARELDRRPATRAPPGTQKEDVGPWVSARGRGDGPWTAGAASGGVAPRLAACPGTSPGSGAVGRGGTWRQGRGGRCAGDALEGQRLGHLGLERAGGIPGPRRPYVSRVSGCSSGSKLRWGWRNGNFLQLPLATGLCAGRCRGRATL